MAYGTGFWRAGFWAQIWRNGFWRIGAATGIPPPGYPAGYWSLGYWNSIWNPVGGYWRIGAATGAGGVPGGDVERVRPPAVFHALRHVVVKPPQFWPETE